MTEPVDTPTPVTDLSKIVAIEPDYKTLFHDVLYQLTVAQQSLYALGYESKQLEDGSYVYEQFTPAESYSGSRLDNSSRSRRG